MVGDVWWEIVVVVFVDDGICGRRSCVGCGVGGGWLVSGGGWSWWVLLGGGGRCGWWWVLVVVGGYDWRKWW